MSKKIWTSRHNLRPARIARLLVFGLALLAIPAGFFVYQLHVPARYVAALKNDTNIDPVVTSVITTSDQLGYSVIKIFGLGGRYRNVEYDFKYKSRGEVKYVRGLAKPIDLTGRDEVVIDVFLGSCVGSVCTPDPDVSDRWVYLEYMKLSGEVVRTGTP